MSKTALTLACVATLVGCAHSSTAKDFDHNKYARLAVLAEERGATSNDEEQTPAERAAETELVTRLNHLGYQPVSRTDLDRALIEIEFQRSSGLSEGQAVQIGKFLNVPGIVIISINRFDVAPVQVEKPVMRNGKQVGSKSVRQYRTHAHISARLVDVATSRIMWSSSHSGYVDNDAQGLSMSKLSYETRIVSRSFPKRE